MYMPRESRLHSNPLHESTRYIYKEELGSFLNITFPLLWISEKSKKKSWYDELGRLLWKMKLGTLSSMCEKRLLARSGSCLYKKTNKRKCLSRIDIINILVYINLTLSRIILILPRLVDPYKLSLSKDYTL